MTRRICCAVAVTALCGVMAGCETDSFFNPEEPHIQAPLKEGQPPLQMPILDTLARGFDDPDPIYAGATEITPDDLVVETSDYRIGKNDMLSISVYDLLGQDTGESIKTAHVSETGMVTPQFLSPIHVEGLTEHEAEKVIADAYQAANYIKNARVTVTVAEALARTFSVYGNVSTPGEFQLTRSDFRMIDAMVISRGPSAVLGLQYVYVLRHESAAATEPTSPDTNQPQQQPGIIQPPSSTSPGILNPPGTPQSRAGSIGGPVSLDEPAPAPAPSPAAPDSPGFTFSDTQPSTTGIRVIRVPIDKLLHDGDMQYNIVIHPGDMIIVPSPVTGFYYVGGHIQRAGAYSISGDPVTLKQAWVSAGGGDDFAVPRRSEVIRRIGPNNEIFVRIDMMKIWAGDLPDIYLRPNDIMMIGTDAIAPFLAAGRNSFRITYGFGFLYDRNFYTGANGF